MQQTIYPKRVYENRLLAATLTNKVNDVSERSAHLIISCLVVTLVFAYMFVHPNASEQMTPIVALIVGHVLGTQKNATKSTDD